jgi:hypothetical protein
MTKKITIFTSLKKKGKQVKLQITKESDRVRKRVHYSCIALRFKQRLFKQVESSKGGYILANYEKGVKSAN